jgi:hypothetical protein
MFRFIIGYLFAVGIGLSLGLIGGGGAVLAVPILVYVIGIPTKPAIAMTLVIVGVVSLIGLVPHWRQGHVKLKTAVIFGASTMLGAYAGARIANLPIVSDSFQLGLFAVMMLIASWLMIRRSSQSSDLDSNSQVVNKYSRLLLVIEGLGVGILTGLVGVGGGFLIVPALVLLGNIAMKEAIGTSLLIIAFNSLAGFLGYLGRVPLDWQLMGLFILAASLGTIAGGYLSQFISAKHLQKGFGYFLIAVAGFILFQQLTINHQ